MSRIAATSAPALIVLAVPLAYEVNPAVPAMTWAPWGLLLALVIIAAAGLGRLTVDWSRPAKHGLIPRRRWMGASAGGTVAILTGAVLILTVAPGAAHPKLRNTSPYNPRASYSSALGGADATYIEEYRVSSELPAFVGKPAYRGEQLIMWTQKSDWPQLYGPMGIYDDFMNAFWGSFPTLDAVDKYEVEERRPGQILLISLDGSGFNQAVQSLSPYAPVVVRRAVLGNSSYHLHVWLVDLTRYDAPAGS